LNSDISQGKKLKVINEAMPDQCSAVDLNVAKVEDASDPRRQE